MKESCVRLAGRQILEIQNRSSQGNTIALTVGTSSKASETIRNVHHANPKISSALIKRVQVAIAIFKHHAFAPNRILFLIYTCNSLELIRLWFNHILMVQWNRKDNDAIEESWCNNCRACLQSRGFETRPNILSTNNYVLAKEWSSAILSFIPLPARWIILLHFCPLTNIL